MCVDLKSLNVGYKNSGYFDSSVASHQKGSNFVYIVCQWISESSYNDITKFLVGHRTLFSPFTQRRKLKVEHPKRNKQCQVAFLFFLSTSYRLLADEIGRRVQRLAGHGSCLYDFWSPNFHTWFHRGQTFCFFQTKSETQTAYGLSPDFSVFPA
jgi:hypothetical protein